MKEPWILKILIFTSYQVVAADQKENPVQIPWLELCGQVGAHLKNIIPVIVGIVEEHITFQGKTHGIFLHTFWFDIDELGVYAATNTTNE